jgi:hypothetical protein
VDLIGIEPMTSSMPWKRARKPTLPGNRKLQKAGRLQIQFPSLEPQAASPPTILAEID